MIPRLTDAGLDALEKRADDPALRIDGNGALGLRASPEEMASLDITEEDLGSAPALEYIADQFMQQIDKPVDVMLVDARTIKALVMEARYCRSLQDVIGVA